MTGSAAIATDVDSLRSLIKDLPSDNLKIAAYIKYSDHVATKDFSKALILATEGLTLAEKTKDAFSAGQLKRQIGEAHYFSGNYNRAAAFLFASAENLEKFGKTPELAKTYNAIAKMFRKTRDLSNATENYDKAMAIYRSLNDSAGIAEIFNESGVVFEYAGDYRKASERYAASLRIDELRRDSIGICYALSNLAGVYTLQKKFGEAEEYLIRSLNIRKQMKDSFSLALNYSDLGNAYFSAGDYRKAGTYLDTSTSLAENLNYRELQSANLEMLAQVAEKQGNFSAALQYYRQRTALHDSIFGFEKTKQLEELNTKYETTKKEGMIREQQDRLKLQNILMIAAVILVLLGSLLAYTQYRRYKWRQEARTQAAILRQQQLAAKAVMDAEEGERKRIATDLHDGVGQIMSAAKMNLSAFRHRINFENAGEESSFENIISLVDAGCKEVRSVSHNMMPNALMNNNLPNAIHEFIDKLDQEKLKVHLFSEGFDNSSSSDNEIVLYRIIQECVNNVIKHANASVLDISLIKDAHEISATIEDNGIGFDMALKSKDEGIGLKNIRTRMDYLKGSVEFQSEKGKGTVVMLHVPAG